MKTLHSGLMWIHWKNNIKDLIGFTEKGESYSIIPKNRVHEYLETYPYGELIPLVECPKEHAQFEALFSYYWDAKKEHVFFRRGQRD